MCKILGFSMESYNLLSITDFVYFFNNDLVNFIVFNIYFNIYMYLV